MGLIGKIEFDDLNVVRIIRNKFAHSYSTLSFSNHEILDECMKLQTLDIVASKKNDLITVKNYIGRERYSITLQWLAASLLQKNINHTPTGKDFNFLGN